MDVRGCGQASFWGALEGGPGTKLDSRGVWGGDNGDSRASLPREVPGEGPPWVVGAWPHCWWHCDLPRALDGGVTGSSAGLGALTGF